MKLFDYGSITEQHKEAIQEVVDLATQSGNDVFAEFIKYKFQLIDPVRVDHKDTEFYKACAENDIHVWIMGYIQDGVGNDPSMPFYPVVSITEDIRKIEKLVEFLKK
jgi:hypothetical protein